MPSLRLAAGLLALGLHARLLGDLLPALEVRLHEIAELVRRHRVRAVGQLPRDPRRAARRRAARVCVLRDPRYEHGVVLPQS